MNSSRKRESLWSLDAHTHTRGTHRSERSESREANERKSPPGVGAGSHLELLLLVCKERPHSTSCREREDPTSHHHWLPPPPPEELGCGPLIQHADNNNMTKHSVLSSFSKRTIDSELWQRKKCVIISADSSDTKMLLLLLCKEDFFFLDHSLGGGLKKNYHLKNENGQFHQRVWVGKWDKTTASPCGISILQRRQQRRSTCITCVKNKLIFFYR